jgi:hypothetical protein
MDMLVEDNAEVRNLRAAIVTRRSCANRRNDELPLRWEERRGSQCRMDAWPR